MWWILNRLFGWQYVTYMFGNSMHTGRVKLMGDTMYAHVCCTGFIPIEKVGREMYALTMTSETLNQMKEHNTNRDKEKENDNNIN